jgi:hypothetical protein
MKIRKIHNDRDNIIVYKDNRRFSVFNPILIHRENYKHDKNTPYTIYTHNCKYYKTTLIDVIKMVIQRLVSLLHTIFVKTKN